MTWYPLPNKGKWSTIIKGYPNNSGSPCDSGEHRHVNERLSLVVEADGADLLQPILDEEPRCQLLRLGVGDDVAVAVLHRGHNIVKHHCTNSSQNACDPHRYGFAATAQPKAPSQGLTWEGATVVLLLLCY